MRIEIDGLSFSYNGYPVLQDLALELGKGEVLGIIGPNGSGKSTLLKCIDRILLPKGRCIFLDGKEINQYSGRELARLVGYVAQSEESRFPVTVFDTILMGRKPFLNWKPSAGDLDKVAQIIKMLHLEPIAMRELNTISGGERQKVMIGRAIAQEPHVMLLDEPTNYLDLRHQLEVMNLIEDLAASGISSVVAIHDLNLASRYCQKLILLEAGKIFAAGGQEVLDPENIEPVYKVKISCCTNSGNTVIVPDRPL
ncbi:MAG: ABC transporter ATP-binding protein [Dethiobacteria bacterium]|nr:ABC transporter ATP-binding protein [Dethiobacteria bacterium]